MTSPDYGHTGRELELMLAGIKPSTMFYDGNEEPDERIIAEKEFGGYVSAGLFVTGIDPRTGRPEQVRYVSYALKSEERRVNAMFLLLETQLKLRYHKGPDEAIERMTSNLLDIVMRASEGSSETHGDREGVEQPTDHREMPGSHPCLNSRHRE